MAVETPRQTPEAGLYSGPSSVESHGEGWLMFAGIMLTIIGTLNLIGGIAAIDDANVYAGNAHYTFGDLNAWGWVILLTGGVQVLAGFGIFARNQLARWLGVGFASLNAMGQLLFLPAFPLWSLALFAVDVLIIYGLVAYSSPEA